MSSALPALSKGVRLTVPHELHHMPPIFQPGKQGSIPTAKSNNLQQARGRKVPNLHNNRQRYKGNMVLPPLEMTSNENSTNNKNPTPNNENVNNANQLTIDPKPNTQPVIKESVPKKTEEHNDSYLDTRYSDEGDSPSENASEEEVPLNESSKSEEIDADPSEFGVTVCKL